MQRKKYIPHKFKLYNNFQNSVGHQTGDIGTSNGILHLWQSKFCIIHCAKNDLLQCEEAFKICLSTCYSMVQSSMGSGITSPIQRTTGRGSISFKAENDLVESQKLFKHRCKSN